MQRAKFLTIGLMTLATLMSGAPAANSQDSTYYAGRAVDGRRVYVDLSSISATADRRVSFIYYLDNERVEAQANCRSGYWVTYPERETHRPQSQATENMLNKVCSYTAANVATVFDPPSNVRVAPNGNVLCTIRERMDIQTYGSNGEWYYTDACGRMGVIHSSQIRF